jgi:subfamily B ATP-binding cassette protein MsbA
MSYVWPYWAMLLIAIFGMVIIALTEAAFAYSIKPLFDDALVKQDALTIKWLPVAIILIFAAKIVGGFLSTYYMSWVSRTVIRDLRDEMFRHILRLPVNYYDNQSSGALLSKMVYDVEQLAEASSTVITVLIRDSLTVVVLLAVLLYYSSELTLILLFVTPFLAVIITYVSRRFRKLSHRIQNSMGDVSSVTEESIEANREIKVFGGQAYEINHFDSINHQNRRQFLKLAVTNALSSPIIQFIVAIALALIIYIAVKQQMSVGEFGSYITTMLLLMQHAKKLTSVNAGLQKGIAAAQSVFSFLDAREEVDNGSLQIEKVTGNIKFDHVNFTYQTKGEKVLDTINLEIEAGQTVAFVGRSGAGKTTLVSLLPRFYDIGTGNITLDGSDINELKLENLRSHIALVSQHVTLFDDSIKHNIAYGSLGNVDDAAIKEAARSAYALEFIEKLPQGFETIVGENGVLLSGGQRQRLAIARAILKNAPILILDEATSALDTESERYIQNALTHLMQDRTTLVIAHRLSTIEKADKIVVMHQGKIAETGTHVELIKQNGHYAALHKMQFSEPGE